MNSLPQRIASGSWWDRARYRRGRRALERQLEYQTQKSQTVRGHEDDFVRLNFVRAQWIRKRLEEVRPILETDKVLEVGSGVHGLVFDFPAAVGIGIDPLAAEYKRLFPTFQRDTPTVSAIGEELPFSDAAFDVVMSDNVIDHAERPLVILDEIVRVLKPGGLLYFTVNVHHPVYNAASCLHGLWNAAGIPVELSAFADHTVHMTDQMISDAFKPLPLQVIHQRSNIVDTKRAISQQDRAISPRSLMRRLFFKNATFELVAVKS